MTVLEVITRDCRRELHGKCAGYVEDSTGDHDCVCPCHDREKAA